MNIEGSVRIFLWIPYKTITSISKSFIVFCSVGWCGPFFSFCSPLRLLVIRVVFYLRLIMSSRWALGPQSSENASPAGESGAFCVWTKLTSEDPRHLRKFLTFPYWENPLTSSFTHSLSHTRTRIEYNQT